MSEIRSRGRSVKPTARERRLEAQLADAKHELTEARRELADMRTLECDVCLATATVIEDRYFPPMWRLVDLPTDETGSEWLSARMCPACVAKFYRWIDASIVAAEAARVR